jgi:hypothetical protein
VPYSNFHSSLISARSISPGGRSVFLRFGRPRGLPLPASKTLAYEVVVRRAERRSCLVRSRALGAKVPVGKSSTEHRDLVCSRPGSVSSSSSSCARPAVPASVAASGTFHCCCCCRRSIYRRRNAVEDAGIDSDGISENNNNKKRRRRRRRGSVGCHHPHAKEKRPAVVLRGCGSPSRNGRWRR